MHWTNSGGGGFAAGTQTSPAVGQGANSSPTQTWANVFHSTSAGGGGGVSPGGAGGPGGGRSATAQTFSPTTFGALIEIDCTQGTPLQSFPAGIASFDVQDPSHPAGASN